MRSHPHDRSRHGANRAASNRRRGFAIARALSAFALSLACAAGAPALFAHEPDAEEIALGSLVDAEIAFARMGWQRGVRTAFLANFASDGIVFEPAPVRLRETWSARPEPADPLATRLEWKPAQAGVARSHDFGYTTGPYTLWNAAQPERKQHGVFFSVWQRNAAGRWQVILDAGITTPGVADFASLGAAPRPQFRGRSNAVAEKRRLLEQEAHPFAPGSTALTPTRYAQLLADDVRLHRDGATPLASRGLVAPEVAQRMLHVAWSPIDARMSASGDMAITYGRYRETDRDSGVRDGYYAHLWVRDAAGRWRLAYDIALRAPP
ncbi:MAG TPA: DUF4440 domain-containing protein [Casimicrobiaceae bacterium]